MIYFDHNATTPVDPRVVAAMLPFFSQFYANPSSLHKMGRLARTAINTAREQVAALVGAQPTQIIFTSGGTEANVLALHPSYPQTHLAISAIEHPSISETAQHLQSLGHTVSIIPVDNNGLIDLAAFQNLLKLSPALVSVMLANNETGCLQPINRVIEQLQALEIEVHTDAVQAAGKIPVNFASLNVDRMSLSSHKIYGPKGCGALVVKDSSTIAPLIFGGGQEKNLRSGTENVAAIVGFGKAAELALSELETRTQHLLSLRKQLEQGLQQIPKLTIFSQNVARLPNTVQFGIDGQDGDLLLMRLDKKNIAVSSGSACAAEAHKSSHVLSAMHVEPALAKSALRISLGQQNTSAEITEFLKIFTEIVLTEGNY